MSYKPIGTPTGNNLYITIPLRGTQNWDQKFEDGALIPISQHDHTPGKGAAIVEAALDAAVRAKLDQIAVNTSNISSNDTDIANLDSRVTDLETNPITELVINNQTEADDLSNQVIINKLVQVASSVNISDVTFRNCVFGIDSTCTFNGGAINGCSIRNGDDTSANITFTDVPITDSSFSGLNTISFEATSNLTISRIDIPTSYTSTIFTNNSSSVNMTVADSNIEGYAVNVNGKVTFTYCKISPVTRLTCAPLSDASINFSTCSINLQNILSGATYSIGINSETNIFHQDNSIATLKISYNNTLIVDKTYGDSSFKIIDGVVTEFDEKGLQFSGTPSDGDSVIYNLTSGEWELGKITTSGGYYIIDSLSDLDAVPINTFTGQLTGVTLNFSYTFWQNVGTVPGTYGFRDCHIISENAITIGNLDACVVHVTNGLTISGQINRCIIAADTITQKANINYSLIQCRYFNFSSSSDILPDVYLRYSKLSCKTFNVSHSYTNNRFYKIIDCNIEASLYAYLTGATYTSTPSMFVENSSIKSGSDLKLSNVISTGSRFSGGFINTTLLGSFDGTAINNAYTTSNAIYDVELIEGNLFHSGSGATGSLTMQVADAKNISSSSANTEYEVLAVGADYDPNSLIVNTNQFEAPSAGVYVINVSCQFSSNASTGSSIYIYKNSSIVKFITKSEPKFLCTGDQVLTLASGDLINITVSTTDSTVHPILTNYAIKKIS